VQSASRLPGVFFETPRPTTTPGLPRMDVTGFVGFAAAGPLHVPVAVEDPARFRELFGDLDGAAAPLAWDGGTGELLRAHLGAAVEAFFANGGARAWVVRVAGNTAVRHRFRLAGLVTAGERAASPPAPVEARARAAGSWCEELAAATAVTRQPVRWQPGEDSPLDLTPGAYALALAARPSEVRSGDLLELDFAPAPLALLLFIDRVEPVPGGVRVLSAPLDTVTGETGGAFWADGIGGGSPGAAPVPMTEADGLAAVAALPGSPADPTLLPAVRRLTFEIGLFRDDELVSRLGDLAFARRHPRFWAALPTDEALFGRVGREQVSAREARNAAAGTDDALESLLAEAFDPLRDTTAELAAQAAEPRFPLAGPPPDAAASYYLPWGMARSLAAADALPLARPFAATTRLERDGLAAFGAGLFVDPVIGRLYQGSLLTEAEHRHDVRALPLRGLHALVPVPEVSLVTVPDSVHRGWTRELPLVAEPLDAPELLPVGPVDPAGRYPVDWSAVPGATAYLLERDDDPAFPRPVVVYAGEETAAPMVLPAGCPRRVWLRVRAERDGETGPWSNTRVARLPKEPFAACAGDGRPGALELHLEAIASPPGLSLTWEQAADSDDPPSPPADAYELEEASDAGFATARSAGPEPPEATELALPAGRPEARFYRVRAWSGTLYGPWSNTVRVPGSERDDWVEIDRRSYLPDDLLAVHRALLRTAAARGDLLALLSLPRHYRASDALDHHTALTPGGGDDAVATTDVPPLTAGETPVLAFGALYHPWPVSRGGDDGQALRRQPPDGPVAGTLASFALGPGAWRAPANRPLVGVLALEPTLGRGDWARLAAAHVNAVIRDPRGFLLLSADTLSVDEAVRPISVRRLLILLRRLALAEGETFVFEANDAFLAELVRNRFEVVLGDLYRRGAFAGATPDAGFRVVTDASVNPPASRDRGRFVTELRVAPARALAFLTVRLIGGGPERLVVQEVA